MATPRVPVARLLLPIALVATFAAGCGDDEERLSEDEFVEQANEICQDAEDDFEADAEDIVGDGSELPSDEQVQELADLIEDRFNEQLDDVEELAAPESLEEDVDELIEESRAIVADVTDDLRDDPSILFDDQEDPFAEVDERLRELGLDDCAG